MREHQVNTDLVKTGSEELVSPAEISKYIIGVETMWFGARDLVNDDLHAFNYELALGKQFRHHASFELPDAGKVKGEPYPAFAQADLAIRRELEMRHWPLAIFIVTTAKVAERPWLEDLPKGLHDLREQQGRDRITFVYEIILGAGFSQNSQQDPAGHFSRNEMRAHELGGVYISYTHDYRSLGIRRTVEFMNRVLGHDLSGEKFPNYTAEEIQRIAWNINREDFNSLTPRDRSIPKYPIVNDKPRFPF